MGERKDRALSQRITRMLGKMKGLERARRKAPGGISPDAMEMTVNKQTSKTEKYYEKHIRKQGHR